MRTIAPAKINWTLEVLGRREDGYHEIRSVMQTIDLCDELAVSRGGWIRPKPVEGPPGTIVVERLPQDFIYASAPDIGAQGLQGESVILAVQLLDSEGERDVGTRLDKTIPAAVGLGGGSSDAAAALRSLNRLWDLGLGRERLVEIGSKIGSDVAFFFSGGTAFAEGRGERITSLPDVRESWVVLLVPPIRMPEKTKRMYEALTAEDFSDGKRSEALAERIRQGERVRDEDLYNAFERAAYWVFEGLDRYRDALLTVGAAGAHLAGAGPALFALGDSEAAARDMARDIQAPYAKIFVARTLGAVEATAVTD